MKSKNAFKIIIIKSPDKLVWVNGIKMYFVATEKSRDSWKVRAGETSLFRSSPV